MLEAIHERLAGVTIEQLSYGDVIRRYDAAETLFYLDPPYVGCESDYGAGFAPADFAALADTLAAIKGRFVLSINDTPVAREVFHRFDIDTVPVTYTIGSISGAGQRTGELIVQGLALNS